jgi:Family of unknown function (DUF5856)
MSESTAFLRTLLYFQNQIRLYHWNTKVYSRHIASGDLYEKIDKFTDKFVEIYQGKFNGGLLSGIPFKYDRIDIELYNLNDEGIIVCLNDFKSMLVEDLYNWLSNMPHHTNSDLKNLVDDLMGDVNKTLYLFTLQ